MTDEENQPNDLNNVRDKTAEKEISQVGQIKKMLEESGIQAYDSQVVTHLSDYMDNYISEILNNAIKYAEHAGRNTSVTLADVKLALDASSKMSCPKRISRKELIELANEYNQSQFPSGQGLGHTPLPTEGTVLTNCTYKLKSPTSQYPINISLMDMSNRANQIAALNTIKNHSGSIPAMLRTSSGAMSVGMPLNLTPQRIVFKPPIPSSNNNIGSQNKDDDNIKKKLKLDDIKK